MSEDKLYWIWLSSIPGIGARRFYKLMEYYENPQRLYYASEVDLKAAAGILGEKTADQLLKARCDENLEVARTLMESSDLEILTLLSPSYPPLLKSIYDPPPVLYCRGRPLLCKQHSIAVVGSRRSSEYGRTAARKISCRLAQAGVTIVSGMARGIDTMAHKGALEAEAGYTIAVLGSGVDYVYPAENAALYRSICDQGTIMSEYPPGTMPSPGNFPARNRIVSGLSHGVLVVEAGTRSGALITVDCALEQGREVYALPGNISSPFSQGTNKLLKEGAKMITSAEDILEDLEGTLAFPSMAMLQSEPERQAPVLDFFESLVYNALEDGEKGLEELIHITQMPAGQLNGVLTLMEIRGIIRQLPGKIFMKQWKT
ncbi:MAG: DNA-processing protein DprA [Caldicoprobacterales bacterium]